MTVTVYLAVFVTATSGLLPGTHLMLNKCLLIYEQTKGSISEVVSFGKKEGSNNKPGFLCTAMNTVVFNPYNNLAQ